MDKDKFSVMKERIEEHISRLDNKDFSMYFYVVDTKGNPSGSLSYIYDIAFGLKEMGYKVAMLHNEEDFVGVEEWLGKEYSDLPHFNVEKSSIDIGPSDFLFIPEVYSNVMTATKKLPCQRIAILQNFDRMFEFIPFGSTWGDLGIFKVITTTEDNAKRLKTYFPQTDVNVITPKISNVFSNDGKMKKLIVNVVTRESGDVNKIVKPFFWQYPMYRWVAFRELRGLNREDFSQALQEAAITVWTDDVTNFGYTALEAMKCGSIVVGRVPDVAPEWMIEEDSENLVNAGIWVDSFATLPNVLASVIRTWTMDGIPSQIQENADKLVSKYTQGKQLQDIKNVIVEKLVGDRKKDFITTLETVNNNLNEKE